MYTKWSMYNAGARMQRWSTEPGGEATSTRYWKRKTLELGETGGDWDTAVERKPSGGEGAGSSGQHGEKFGFGGCSRVDSTLEQDRHSVAWRKKIAAHWLAAVVGPALASIFFCGVGCWWWSWRASLRKRACSSSSTRFLSSHRLVFSHRLQRALKVKWTPATL
jgi:hypothetical protein